MQIALLREKQCKVVPDLPQECCSQIFASHPNAMLTRKFPDAQNWPQRNCTNYGHTSTYNIIQNEVSRRTGAIFEPHTRWPSPELRYALRRQVGSESGGETSLPHCCCHYGQHIYGMLWQNKNKTLPKKMAVNASLESPPVRARCTNYERETARCVCKLAPAGSDFATDASESDAKRRDFFNRNCHHSLERRSVAPFSRKIEAQGFSSCD